MMILIIGYALLVFASLGLENFKKDSEGSIIQNIQDLIKILTYVECGILVVFIFEISAKCYAFEIKNYFRDKWLVVDAVVILLSIVLVLLDINLVSHSFNSISKGLRGVFRFLRIMLLFRKVTQFKKFKTTYSRYDVKSPVEKVIEILNHCKGQADDEKMLLSDIDWCIDVISNNKLYDPFFEASFKEGSKEDQNKIIAWIEVYSNQKRVKTEDQETKLKSNKRSSIISMMKQSISRRPSSLGSKLRIQVMSDETFKIFENFDEIDFNIFEFAMKSQGNLLQNIFNFLFQKFEIFQKLSIDQDKMLNFANKVQNGYLDNPYHNKIHAADVTQTVHFFLWKCNFAELAEINPLELAAMYISAGVHDIGHIGYNNIFLINSKHHYALLYNDKSVLENYHLSQTYKIIQESTQCDIFSNFSKNDDQRMREMVIGMVLSTDMSFHFSDLAKIKGRLQTNDFDIQTKDKTACMNKIIHSSDISNPLKPFNLCYEWTIRVLDEFWKQGDRERELNLPISYLCDRYTVNIAKSQIGFIDVIVRPTFEVVKTFLPSLQPFIDNLDENKAQWQQKIEIYEEKLQILNEEKNKQNNQNKKDYINQNDIKLQNKNPMQ